MKRLALMFLATACGPEPAPVDPNDVDVDGDIGAMCRSWRERCAGGDTACCDLTGDHVEIARSCEERWQDQQDGPVAWDIPCMTSTPCAQIDAC